MEHLPGRTLKEVVESEAPLAQDRVVDLGPQSLQAAVCSAWLLPSLH